MQLPIYQVDAFTDKLFGGNPAAVCPLEFWPDDDLLQSIARENNLSETAFYLEEKSGYRLRWFTPTVEVRLCGHATLATAHVLFQHRGYTQPCITFYTLSGELTVMRIGPSKYLMDFPSDHPIRVEDKALISKIETALDAPVTELWKGKDDYLAVHATEKDVRELAPDFRSVARLESRGLICTSKGKVADFVSRGFFPQTGVDEDPATGSAHTLLTPYWAPRLRSNSLRAQQLSSRIGYFECVYKGDRTAIIGNAVDYLQGSIHTSIK